MFEYWKEWRSKRRAKREHKDYIAGYDYAAGCLLRCEKTPFELDAEQDHNPDWFDRGMNRAIEKVCSTGYIKDDRV